MWLTPVIIVVFERLKQNDHKFIDSLDYTARPCVKKKKQKKTSHKLVAHVCNPSYLGG
jgi:hypothetical protein